MRSGLVGRRGVSQSLIDDGSGGQENVQRHDGGRRSLAIALDVDHGLGLGIEHDAHDGAAAILKFMRNDTRFDLGQVEREIYS